MTYQQMHVRRKSEESKMNVDYMKTLACSTCKLNGSCETQKKIADDLIRQWAMKDKE